MILGSLRNGESPIYLKDTDIIISQENLTLDTFIKQSKIPSEEDNQTRETISSMTAQIQTLTNQLEQVQETNQEYKKQIDFLLDQISTQEKEASPWVFYDWSNIPERLISTALDAHYNGTVDLANYWKVGDYRTYRASNGEEIYFTIADFNRDPLTDTTGITRTKAAITLAVSTNHLIREGNYNDYGFWRFSPSNTPLSNTETLFENFVSSFNNCTLTSFMKTVNMTDFCWRNASYYEVEDTPYVVRYPAIYELLSQHTLQDFAVEGTYYTNNLWNPQSYYYEEYVLGKEKFKPYFLFSDEMEVQKDHFYIFTETRSYESEVGVVLRMYDGGEIGSPVASYNGNYFPFFEKYSWDQTNHNPKITSFRLKLRNEWWIKHKLLFIDI